MPERHGPPPLRDLGLRIAGTELEPIVTEFVRELDRAGVRRVRPHFYLSTEWGVPFGTVAIAIPFYLARPDLKALHAERAGFVEGVSRADILRYLRHEMGHVVNYAYKLYDDPQWVEQFGSITQPYEEEYRPEPFSRRFVRHLPAWYAQKHPDEDWAETFAVWMTPGRDWRAEYAGWPTALAKLGYCDRRMAELADRPPLVDDVELDADVGEMGTTLDELYGDPAVDAAMPPGLDGALQGIFEDPGAPEGAVLPPRKSAAELIRRLRNELSAEVYRWTGHFPERTRPLVEYLAKRAGELQQVYPADREEQVVVALTALVTALAMNYVARGSYFA
jgi:hypothetical protein